MHKETTSSSSCLPNLHLNHLSLDCLSNAPSKGMKNPRKIATSIDKANYLDLQMENSVLSVSILSLYHIYCLTVWCDMVKLVNPICKIIHTLQFLMKFITPPPIHIKKNIALISFYTYLKAFLSLL